MEGREGLEQLRALQYKPVNHQCGLNRGTEGMHARVIQNLQYN